MFTEQQLEALRTQIRDMETQVHELESNIRFIKGQIKDHNFEVVKSQFPDLKEGDLVEVLTYYNVPSWVPGGKTHKQFTTQRLFFKEMTVETWSDPSCMSNIQFIFNERKKDGTPSKKTKTIYVSTIDSIQVVTVNPKRFEVYDSNNEVMESFVNYVDALDYFNNNPCKFVYDTKLNLVVEGSDK